MKPSTFYFLLFTFLTLAAFAQPSKSLTNFMTDGAVSNAAVSIYFADASTGEVLVASQPQIAVTPASVFKLITSATALEKLGKDFRFNTSVSISGKIENRILNGNLIVTGGGDPTLGSGYFNVNKSEFLSKWVHAIKQAGIDSIAGNIVVDPSIYSDQDVVQNWLWEDIGSYYGAAAQGISVYDNSFEISFRTSDSIGGRSEILFIQPQIPDLVIENQVVSGSDNRDRSYVFGNPADNFRIVKGTLPKGKNDYRIASSIPDPAKLLAYELRKTLQDSLINIHGTIEKKKTTSDSSLFKWESPALSEIIQQLNFESINLYAEHLLKQIGLTTYGDGSTALGVKAVTEYWKEKGIDTRNLFIADGSGLSRFNAITAKTLVDVLLYMQKDSINFSVYEQSLPITGANGTMKNYFQESVLRGKAHVKSGSMTRVRSLAGYMPTKSGRTVAFTVMVNNFSCTGSEMAKKMEKLMEQVYWDF